MRTMENATLDWQSRKAFLCKESRLYEEQPYCGDPQNIRNKGLEHNS